MLNREIAIITFTFQDRESNKSTHTICAKGDVAVVDHLGAYRRFADDYLSFLMGTPSATPDDTASLLGVFCLGYTVTFKSVQDEAVDLDNLFADVEDKSVIIYVTEQGFKAQSAIPGCYAGIQLVDGVGLSPDLDISRFAGLVGMMIDGIDYNPIGFGGVVRGCDARSENLMSVKAAYKQQRGSQKGANRKG